MKRGMVHLRIREVGKLSPEELKQLKAEAFEKVQLQKQADGFHYRLEAFCTVARQE